MPATTTTATITAGKGGLGGLPSKVSDFYVLPVEVPAAIESWAPCYHHLYLRRHRAQYTYQIGADTSINGRSLYAVNVPVDSTLSHFRAIFSRLSGARVETVIFEDEPVPKGLRAAAKKDDQEGQKRLGFQGPSKKRKRQAEAASVDYLEASGLPRVWDRAVHRCGSSAVIVFVDTAGVEATLKVLKNRPQSLEACTNKKILWGDGVGEGNQVPNLGSARYENHRRLIYPDMDELLVNIDKVLASYDIEQAAIEEIQNRAANEPDEDGFVTVVRGPKARVEPTTPETTNSKKKAASVGKGMYSDFYRFQLRDMRKQQMKNILTKFEDDKRKIKDLKNKRKF